MLGGGKLVNKWGVVEGRGQGIGWTQLIGGVLLYAHKP